MSGKEKQTFQTSFSKCRPAPQGAQTVGKPLIDRQRLRTALCGPLPMHGSQSCACAWLQASGLRTLKLACGENAAAQGLGTLFRSLNRLLDSRFG